MCKYHVLFYSGKPHVLASGLLGFPVTLLQVTNCYRHTQKRLSGIYIILAAEHDVVYSGCDSSSHDQSSL